MASIIASMRDAANKYAAYRRTVDEIQKMPLDVALDLNIYRGDAEEIAFKAVYGA